MRKKRKPAMHRGDAWLTENRGSKARHFGSVPTDRLYLEERLFRAAGKLKIYTEFDRESVRNYRRWMDERTGIIHASFDWQGHLVELTVFASTQEDLIFYEITADTACLNLTASFEPEIESAYLNYNLGGFYFEEEKKGRLLIGKGELKADGFPKADEKGIHVKNASRAAFRLYLKSERRSRRKSAAAQAMEMQMNMNRYLAKTDDISREKLLKLQGCFSDTRAK